FRNGRVWTTMSIIPRDPWGEMLTLREAMDELLRESFVRPRTLIERATGGSLGMPIDVRDTEDSYTIKATLPGAKPEDIHLQIKGDVLTTSAETKEETEEKEGQWLVRERRHGRMERTISLPAQVQADKADATFEHGVLTIMLPKAEEARGRSIPVRSGERSG